MPANGVRKCAFAGAAQDRDDLSPQRARRRSCTSPARAGRRQSVANTTLDAGPSPCVNRTAQRSGRLVRAAAVRLSNRMVGESMSARGAFPLIGAAHRCAVTRWTKIRAGASLSQLYSSRSIRALGLVEDHQEDLVSTSYAHRREARFAKLSAPMQRRLRLRMAGAVASCPGTQRSAPPFGVMRCRAGAYGCGKRKCAVRLCGAAPRARTASGTRECRSTGIRKRLEQSWIAQRFLARAAA